MSRFRDEMRKARAILHAAMGDRALAFSWPPETDDNDEPIAPELTQIKVRVHESFNALGDLKGTNYHYAEVEDNSPVAVFWLNEPSGFAPERDMHFVTEYGRYYRVTVTHPKDDQTQNADVLELTETQTAGMPRFE